MLAKYLVECLIDHRLHACKLLLKFLNGCILHACIVFEKKSTVIVDFMIANYFHKIPQWLDSGDKYPVVIKLEMIDFLNVKFNNKCTGVACCLLK